MKNKKGFTLTELLATLVVLGILLIVAIPSIGKLQEKFKKDYYTELDATIRASARIYYKDNSESMPNNLLESVFIEYENLTAKKYIDSINKYRNNSPCAGKVVVMKVNDDFIYKNCMECEERNYSAAKTKENKEDNLCAFKADDKIVYDYGTINNPLYIHVNNYTNVLVKKELCKARTVYRYQGSTKDNFLYMIEDKDTETMRCPLNISSINLRNKGSYTAKYPMDNKDGNEATNKDVTVVVFQHQAPIVKNPSSTITRGNIIPSNGIKLTMDKTTFDTDHASSFDRYEYYGGSTWNKVECSTTPSELNDYKCEVNLNSIAKNKLIGNKIQFRVVGKSNRTGTLQYGLATSEFTIRVNVTFDGNGGKSDIASKWYTYKDKYGSLPNATRKGYIFDDWYTSASGGTKIEPDLNIDSLENYSVHAHWIAKKINVIFIRNISSTDNTYSTQSFTYGLKNQKFTNKGWDDDKSGYNLVGWSRTRSGKIEYSKLSDVSDDWINTNSPRIILFGVWAPKSYSISYVLNGGTQATSGVPLSYKAGEGATINGKPSRSDYEFNGWSTSSSLTSSKFTQTIGTSASGDKTFYAKWCQKCASVLNGSCSLDAKTAGTCKYTTSCNSGYTLTSGAGTRNPICKEDAHYYKISLDKNGGSGGTNEIYEKYGVNIYRNSSYTEIMTISRNPIVLPAGKKYTVKFDMNGTGIEKPDDRSVKNWFYQYDTKKDGTGEILIDFYGYITNKFTNKYFNSNSTLYAQWGNDYVYLPELSKKDNNCVWAKGSPSGEKYSPLTWQPISENTTFYAVCMPKKYKFYLHAIVEDKNGSVFYEVDISKYLTKIITPTIIINGKKQSVKTDGYYGEFDNNTNYSIGYILGNAVGNPPGDYECFNTDMSVEKKGKIENADKYETIRCYYKEKNQPQERKLTKTINVTFDFNKSQWKGNSNITKQCYFYDSDTTCTVIAPTINPIPSENSKTMSTSKSVRNQGNQKYSDLLSIKGWSKDSNATSASIASGGTITISSKSDQTYYAIVTLSKDNREFYVFPNEEAGLYCNKEPFEKPATGMISANSATDAHFIAKKGLLNWKYVNDDAEILWIKGSIKESELCIHGARSNTRPNDPICDDKFVSARWLSW